MSFLERWDAAAFLGFDVWSFSARSLFQSYGKGFLSRAILRHPWRVLAGLWRYRQRVRPARGQGIAPVGVEGWADFREDLSQGEWLMGIGFCQRPTEPKCPSERFGHECRFLDQPHGAAAPACQVCEIREVAERAPAAGTSIYLMTSASDIARDLLLPALNGGPQRRVLLCLCPYSVAPLSLALTICGLRGLILSYSQGDCRDYGMWLRADVGDKFELTRLPREEHRRLLEFLDQVADARASHGAPTASHHRRDGEIYTPAG